VRTIVAIGIAGALGNARARRTRLSEISTLSVPFPWGTFVVNMSGAFVLGFLMTLMTEQHTTAPWVRSALTISLLGAYTTLSTLSYETYRLVEDCALGQAAANMLGSAAVGLFAVYLGVVSARVL
jgi:CrcB protein